MTCNRCDVMNIHQCDVKLKWNRRVTEKGGEMGGGGWGVGGRGERERAC